MADEEQGFTFVDKRRAAADEPAPAADAPPAAAAPEPAALPPDDQYTADEQGEGSPDIYGVLGYCVSILASQAWQLLGLIADQSTGEARADLVQAKVAIDAAGDLAARLEAAPEASVPDAMKRELRTLMQDLRLNFVAQQGQSR